MKALIFAAGLGTRLKPFTLHHPKALVPVGGIPMLRRVIDRISAIGSIDSIVINVHHFSGQVIGYINSHRHEIPVEIHISDESGRLLDTGGGILNARHLLDDGQPFLVHNADILSDINLESMISCHVKSGAAATLLARAPRLHSRSRLPDAELHRFRPRGIPVANVRLPRLSRRASRRTDSRLTAQPAKIPVCLPPMPL